MTESKVIWIRLIGRFMVVETLIISIVTLLVLLVRELPSDPSQALVSFLSGGVLALGTSLGLAVHSITKNMESQNSTDI